MDLHLAGANVRPAQAADAAAIAHVHVNTWREAYRGIVEPSLLDSLRDEEFLERWTRNLAQSAPDVRTHWIATVRSGVVGFASAGPSRDADADRTRVGELYAMYVLPSAWGVGAGRALMDEALKFLRRTGWTTATLWVLTENTRARRFYEKAGLRLDGATEVHRKGDTDLHETRYRMTL